MNKRGVRMSNSESLLIDMDGVIADTMGGMFDYVEEHFGHSLAHEDIQDYWFQNLPRSDIFTALRSRGFYRNLDVITGAVRAVNRLREEYNGNVYICSKPMDGLDTCETEKRDWLTEYFDEDFAINAIIAHDKTTVQGRVIIEDNPEIAGGIWQPVIFDQPYNRHSQYPRMYGWHDLQVVRDAMRSEPNRR
jgi:5'(3')-deoxyribonucleotidase